MLVARTLVYSFFNILSVQIILRVISGDEEALYDWLAISSAFKRSASDVFIGFRGRGAVDMGGESKQVAFAVAEEDNMSELAQEKSLEHCKPHWIVKFPYQKEFKLFTRSYNGFGIIASMNLIARAFPYTSVSETERTEMLAHELRTVQVDPEGSGIEAGERKHQLLHHPCYAPGVFPPGEAHDLEYDLNGAGNFSVCLDLVRDVFLPMIPKTDIACIMVKLQLFC